MFPGFSCHNVADAGLGHSKPLCQVLFVKATGGQGSDLQHFNIGQFRHSVALSADPPVCRTSLLNHLAHVFCLISESQVIWITTPGIITRVKDEAATGYELVVVQHPGDAVGGHYERRLKPSGMIQIHFAVPHIRSSPQPRPAFVLAPHADTGPKAAFDLVGKQSRKDVPWDRFGLHKSVCLICAAPPAASTARGHLHFKEPGSRWQG